MITDPRYNDPSYILNLIDDDRSRSVNISLDEKQVSGPKFYYPQCGNQCLINGVQTIQDGNYLFEDGRCFKSLNSCYKYDCLEKVLLDSTSDPSAGGNLGSCSNTIETRVKGTRARYIRVERGNSINPVSINAIEAYDIFGTYIKPIIGRSYPLDGENYGINLLDRNQEKIAKTLNTDDAYVQIDLGKDYTIYMVAIFNVEPYNNIIGNNLVMFKDDRILTLKYPITSTYSTYYITTKYDPRYIPDNEIREVEPYFYPSCVQEGCIKDGTTLPGYKYKFDKPIPQKEEDLMIPYDNRCFNTTSECDGYCLSQIIEGKFPSGAIDQYFVSCDGSSNTMYIKIPGKYIRLERTNGSGYVELSELEAFNSSTKYIFSEIRSFPNDLNNPPENLVDNDYSTVTKTLPQYDARIQCILQNDESMISHLYVSIPTSDIEHIYGTTLFVINKYDYIIHNFTFTPESVVSLPTVNKGLNTTTYKIFTNGTGILVGKKKDMRDIYNYPKCIPNQCIIDGKQLNGVLYNLPDGRCVKTVTDCSESNCLDLLKDNLLPFSNIDNNFLSCSDTIDTRILPVYGRYIKIQREGTNKGFNVPEIYVIGQTQELSIVSSISYPITNVNGTSLYAKYAYDRISNSYASVKDSINLQNPFMQFDLGSNKMITKIRFQAMDESLNGINIYILNTNNELVFSDTISGASPGAVVDINTMTFGSQDNNIITMSTKTIYSYPDCIIEGCTPDGHFIKDQRYENAANDTCFIAKSEDLTCVSKIGNLYGSEMDKCFGICDNTDNRYGPSMGRFIRLRNISGRTIVISELSAFNKDNQVYPISVAFSKNVTDMAHRSDGIIDKSGTTSVTGLDSYVQIDLGKNNIIYKAKIDGTIGDCILEVISESGLVVSSNSIQSSGTYDTRQNISPILVNPGLEETFDYPTCNLFGSFKDCVDIKGRPKPFFKYNTVTGSCGIAKVPCIDCLSKLNTGTLTSKEEADMYFSSCTSGETRYPSLRGRYVRVQSAGTAFKILKLNAYDSDAANALPITAVDTFAYPSNTGSTNLTTGSSFTNVLAMIDSIIPFVQLDLGEDKLIKLVDVIPVQNDTSLSNAMLFIITSSGTTVFQKSLGSFTNPILIAAFPGIYQSLTLSNNFNYPSCKQYSCLTNGHQVWDQQYNIGTRCFRAKNTNSEANCLSKIPTLFGADMDACFDKCGTEDTRYDVLSGKYIRITRTIDTEMKISEIKAIKSDNTIIPIYSAFASGCIDINHRSDKLNIPDNYTSVVGTGSYVQIMFEAENVIKNITIGVPIGSTFNNLVGSIIQILDRDKKVNYEYSITSSTPQLSDLTKTFTVYKTANGSIVLSTSREYSYPDCSTSTTNFECVTETGLSKPEFKYNLSQNRCVIAKNKCNVDNCMTKLNQNTLTDNEMTTNFNSCDSTGQNQTQYPPINGQYIRIERGNSSNFGFTVKSIEAYDVNKLNAAHTRSFPLSGLSYSKYMKDLTDLSIFTIVGDGISDATGVTVKPFVQLDYLSDIRIQRIVVTIKQGDTSMDGTVLKIINSNGDTVYQTGITIIPGINTYTFYTVDKPGTTKTPSNLQNSFLYDSCTTIGCIDENMIIKNQKYNTSDGRCLLAKDYLPVSQCLFNVNSLLGPSMDVCFNTCTTGLETRYPRLTARFIRIRQFGSKISSIKIYKLVAYGTNSSGLTIEVPILGKHCKPNTNITYRSDNINSGSVAGTDVSNLAYIQIDLGSDTRIDSIKINWMDSIDGTELVAISQDGLVKYSSLLTGTKYLTSNETILPASLNIQSPTERVNTSETYVYPTTLTIFDDGLDINSKPKLLFIYRLDNNLAVKVKSICPTNLGDCLNLVNTNTMTKANMDLYFDSVSSSYDTRFPNPAGRYIRIQRTDVTNTGFMYRSIIVKDTNDNQLSSIANLVYPRLNATNTETRTDMIIGTPNADEPGKSFIQLDFDSPDKKIRSITLVAADTSLRGTTLYVITSNGSTIYQTDLNFIDVGTNSIELLLYPEMIKNSVTMSYKFIYDACVAKGCTTLDNYHYENQMYKLPDGRCLKSIGSQSVSTCLGNVDNLDGSSMDNCFASCMPNVETRYRALTARFIRIRQTNNRILPIKLFTLLANGIKADGTSGILDVVTKHCKPLLSIDNKSDLLNITGSLYPTGAVGTNAYIQIDLGSDVRIDTVKLNWNGPINGTELVIIRQDGSIKHKTQLIDNIYSQSGETTLTVNLNTVSTENVNIVETYTYPLTKTNFDGGLDSNNRPKLLYIYNLDNNISVKVKNFCTIADCLDLVNRNVMSKDNINLYFDSTNVNYDTRFPNPIAKYIIIKRNNGTKDGFGFSSITFSGNANVVPTNTLVYPLKVSPFTADSISSNPGPNEPEVPFMLFDFGTPNRIQFINILLTDNSLSGTTIYAFDENRNILSQKNITLPVPRPNSVAIELNKYFNEVLPTVPMSYNYNISTCGPLGCTPNNKQFDYQKYISDDLRCFQAKGYRNTSECLSLIDSPTMVGSVMDSCFNTCGSVETRYPRLTGRFVRIRQGSGRNSDIKLFKLIANGPSTNNVDGPLDVLTKHCRGIISNGTNIKQFRSDNLNVNTVDPAGATGSTGYIQIDLGENKRINSITIKRLGSVDNTELIILTQSGIIKHITPIRDSLFTNGDEITLQVTSNAPVLPAVNVIEEFNYPTTMTSYDGGLDENNRPKILFKYIFNNGLSVIPISLCSIIQESSCLDKVYNNLLSKTEMYSLFVSTSSTYDTRFPNPSGRYIRIQRIGSNTGFNITNIEIRGPGDMDVWIPVRSIVYPFVSNFSAGNIDVTTLTSGEPGAPFVQLDLGTDKIIRFVKITTSDTTANGTMLYVINSAEVVQTQDPLNMIVSGLNTIEVLKVPFTPDTVKMSYKFKYGPTGCKLPGCITTDGFDYANQMYEMDDLRCYKSIGNKSIIDCLNKVKVPGGLYGTNMDSCFNTCYTDYDSRYPNTFGRFIRISRINQVTGGTNIKLASVVAFKPAVSESAVPTAIIPLTAHAQRPVGTSFGSMLIDGNNNTFAECYSDGYLQIDLGSNMFIKKVQLVSASTDSTNLIGTKLQIIRDDDIPNSSQGNGSLVHETILESGGIYSFTSNTLNINTEEKLPGSTKIGMMETFTWDCTSNDCIGPAGRTKPKFKYNFSDGRCLVSKNNGLDGILPKILNYDSTISTNDILTHFDSCNANYLTQFSSINGRYIRIKRTDSVPGPINISNIVVKNKSGTVMTTPTMKTFAKPLKTLSDGTYSYSKYLLDTTLNTSTITDSVVDSSPLDTSLDLGYVQIDLGSDMEIGLIEISHIDTTAAQTLNASELIIISSSGSVVYRQNIPPVTGTQRSIRIQSMSITPGYTFNNSEIFTYPGCNAKGCITEDENLIKDFRYKLSDDRCFKAKDDVTAYSILDRAVSKDTSLNINTYFASCRQDVDTRYIPAVGRYVRIERLDGIFVQLSRFEVRNSQLSFITPVDVHVKPADASQLNNYEALKVVSSTTNVRSGASPSGTPTYIQLDLGSDVIVREIIINPSSVDPQISGLYGSTLYFIKQDGTITYQVQLNSTTLSTSSFVVY